MVDELVDYDGIPERAAKDRVGVDDCGHGERLSLPVHGVIQEPLDKIRAGQLKPRSLTPRILVPDTSEPMAVPCRSDDLGDDPEFRQRASRIMLRHGQAILDSVEELADLGMVENARAEIRIHGVPPLFKLYVLNNKEACGPGPQGPQARKLCWIGGRFRDECDSGEA